MLNNPVGVFLYLMLRNDWAWGLLSREEKEMILRVNRTYNADREDYADPKAYGAVRMEGGENWDSSLPRDKSKRGRELLSALARASPRRVLEIGPGAGFFSRVVCDHPSVQHYSAVDVGGGFLEYLRPRLLEIQTKKPDFTFETFCGEASSFTLKNFDLVLLLSCVHHIPNRVEFFRNVAGFLAPGGYVFCYDPSHYLSRWLRLLRNMILGDYLRPSNFMKRENLSTHHFCTIGEYREILKKVPELELVAEFYTPAAKAKYLGPIAGAMPSWFSIEMGVLLRKKPS